MRDKAVTSDYYIKGLGFRELGGVPGFDDYFMIEKDGIELHFFAFKTLDPLENYGQVYIRTNDVDGLYQSMLDKGLAIHPNGPLQVKPWGQKEFSMLDPDHNLLTFGQGA